MKKFQLLYQRDGYAVIPQLIAHETRQILQEAINELVLNYDPSQQGSVFRTDDGDQGRDKLFFLNLIF